MSFFSNSSSTFKILLTCLFTCYLSVNSFGQAAILNGDGTPMITSWCHNDTMHQIVGQPAGGTFSGCGVIEDNGIWYFNPAVAAAGHTSIHYCTLTYTPPQENPVSLQIAIQMPLAIWLRDDSITTCDGRFFLFADFANVGSVQWYWSPGVDLDDSSQKGTGGQTFEDKLYTFHATNRNNGCSDKAEVMVYYRGIEADFTASKDTVCVGERVFFNAENVADSFGYAWRSGDGVNGTGEQWEYAYSSPGVYGVWHILNNEYCLDTIVKDVVVRDFQIELTADNIQVDRGSMVLLQTGSAEPFTVKGWRPDEIFNDQRAYSQTITADTTRKYVVIGESAYGCIDSAELTISVNPFVFIPSSFTPNGDGRNDYFRLVNWGDPVIVTQFRVFDRWGREVWVGNGAAAFIGWDGNLKGEPADMGVYHYIFEGQLPSGEVISKKGDLTLLR